MGGNDEPAVEQSERTQTRRLLLSSLVGASLSAMAGCSGDSTDNPDGANTNPDGNSNDTSGDSSGDGGTSLQIFTDLTWEAENELVGTIQQPKSDQFGKIDQIRVEHDGEVQQTVDARSTYDMPDDKAIAAPLIEARQNLQNETYTFTALDKNGNEIAAVEKTYTADPQVVDINTQDDPNRDLDEIHSGHDYHHGTVVMKNNGNAPVLIEHMGITDGVPEPEDPPEEQDGYPMNAYIYPGEQKGLNTAFVFKFIESRQSEWSENLRTVRDEFPEDYKDGGFRVEATVMWAKKEQFEQTLEIEYGKMKYVEPYNTDPYWVTRSVTAVSNGQEAE